MYVKLTPKVKELQSTKGCDLIAIEQPMFIFRFYSLSYSQEPFKLTLKNFAPF